MNLLAPYRVLDLTDVRGQIAGMMLGDLGADVVRVEPPGGSAARQTGPFLPDGPDADRSLIEIGLPGSLFPDVCEVDPIELPSGPLTDDIESLAFEACNLPPTSCDAGETSSGNRARHQRPRH